MTITLGDNVIVFVYIAAGVLVGVVLPLLSKYVKEHFSASAIDFKPYALLLAFSLVLGAVILAALRQASPDTTIEWYAAFLAGYGGEATLEKLLKS